MNTLSAAQPSCVNCGDAPKMAYTGWPARRTLVHTIQEKMGMIPQI